MEGQEAHKAYCDKAKELFDEFANNGKQALDEINKVGGA